MRTDYKRDRLTKRERQFIASLLDADIAEANEAIGINIQCPPDYYREVDGYTLAIDEKKEKEPIAAYLKGEGDRAEWKEDYISGYIRAYCRQRLKEEKDHFHNYSMYPFEGDGYTAEQMKELNKIAKNIERLERLTSGLNQIEDKAESQEAAGEFEE